MYNMDTTEGIQMEKQIEALVRHTIYPALCEDIAEDPEDRKIAWELLIKKIQEARDRDLEEM